MTINVSSLGGGGGVFIPDAVSEVVQIASPQSADVTVPCPAGKRILLTMLTCNASLEQDGVSVSFGARQVLSSVNVVGSSDDATAAGVKIGNSFSGGSSQPPIIGNINEDLVFSFDAATSVILYYAYQTGI